MDKSPQGTEVSDATSTMLAAGINVYFVQAPCMLNFTCGNIKIYIDGLVQDCSISSALAMELLQNCTKPSICLFLNIDMAWVVKFFLHWRQVVYTMTGEWWCHGGTRRQGIFVQRAGLMRSQQDPEMWWSVPFTCAWLYMSFLLFCLFITIFIFVLNDVLSGTFWILTYYKIWILLNMYCFIWNYWIIYFVTCLEVFWSVMS